MNKIKLKSIKFGAIPFRRLKNLEIPIAERITLIAGHNGTGKSTILGLLANASGLSSKTYESYFHRAYQANFQEIFSLSPEYDFTENVEKKPYVEISYDVSGTTVTKKCNTTRRGSNGLRIVPRNEPKKDFINNGIIVPRDGKVPVPTIYLGMSRIIPIGESTPSDVESSTDAKIEVDDARYIARLVSAIVDTGVENEHTIINQSIKRTKKTSKHPPYSYDIKAISLGQDSLSAIVTALASFKKVKRELGGEYPGGVLVIDELDAGLHPRAQIELFKQLKSEARKLSLQIIVTTHSLVLIEQIYSENEEVGMGYSTSDKVIYIQDTRRPRYRSDMSLNEIKSDMHLLPATTAAKNKLVVKIYTEDDEAKIVLDVLLGRSERQRILRETEVKVKIVSAKMGCNNLMSLYKADDYFKTVVIVLDADSNINSVKNKKNIIKLPSAQNVKLKQSPEVILYSFCESLRTEPDNHLNSWAALDKINVTTDYLRANLRDVSININNREQAKKWFNEKFEHIKRLNLIRLWLDENKDSVQEFLEELVAAVKSVSLMK